MTVPGLEDRPTVLVLADYYLPGYKAGGPIRTLQNMIETLGGSFRFLVITRDRDTSDSDAYSDVKVDDWNEVGSARVFYASPSTLSWSGLGALLHATRHDILYLNSFFSPKMTGLPLLLRRFARDRTSPVVIAPRGEFSPGALALKSLKKRVYLRLARASGLLRDLRWQATNEIEKSQIRSAVSTQAKAISVVPNLLSLDNLTRPTIPYDASVTRMPGPLRIVFLSRIAPMKNLDFLLDVLRAVISPISVTVHGPVTDVEYWAACQGAIRKLPQNIAFSYAGVVAPDRILETFAAYDLFVFPTRGENFGHVIIEALAAGTGVIVSDRTPWGVDPGGAVTVLSLDKPQPWVDVIEQWAGLDARALAARREAASGHARQYLSTSRAAELHEALFLSVLAVGSKVK